MASPGAGEGRERVEAWVRDAPLRDLLPERRRDAAGEHVGAAMHAILPLGAHTSLVVADPGDGHGLLVVPVVDAPHGPRRARAGDGAFAAIARAMLGMRSSDGFRGEHLASGTGRDLDDERGPGDDEEAIDADQSNDSVVVGGSVVVKLLPRTSPGPQPGLDLPAHLASVGFEAIPRPVGALRWTTPAGNEAVLATAASFLPGARDGWTWYLDRLLATLDGAASEADALEPASALGAIVARMHAGLATPSRRIPDPVGRADPATAEVWRDRALATARTALALTSGPEGERLASRAQAIAAELEGLAGATGAPVTRVHGDLHVGQVLEWAGGYAITDFDGNPVAPPEERTAFDTPVRDVAAFVCSIDHLGRVAAARRPGSGDAVDAWISTSRAAFLDAYRSTLAELGSARLFDPSLVRPLSVAQECHEFVYAARFLRSWRYVPDLAMRALLPDAEA